MRFALVILMISYVLSQFYRAFLAVLAEPLRVELGITAAELSGANGSWFLAFAAMQIPVGWALDKIGPRRTNAVLLGVFGTSGAVLFAMAQTAAHINIAMILIGVGCASILMSALYILGRMYPPAVFATMAGVTIGVGTIGNIGAAMPLTLMIELFGWRMSVIVIAAITLLLAIGGYIFVQDPEKIEGQNKGSLLDILKIPQLWLIIPLSLTLYATVAGLRGVWIGPYFTDIHGATETQVGFVTMAMAMAMVAGSFAYGPLDRILKTRKWIVICGTSINISLCFWLFSADQIGFSHAMVIFIVIGFFGSSFPVVMAHARSFYPPHLIGRGITLINLCSMGGAGLWQKVSGTVFETTAGDLQAQYAMVFALFGGLSVMGLCFYVFSTDRVD